MLAKIIKLQHESLTHIFLSENRINGQSLSILLNGIMKYLSQNYLSFHDFEVLFTSLSKHCSLISLDVSNKIGLNDNKLGIKGAVALKQLLQSNQIIEFLALKGLNITIEIFNLFMDGILQNQSLISLDLSRNQICSIYYFLSKQQYIYLFISIKVSVVPQTNIEQLILRSNRIGDQGLQEINAHFPKYFESPQQNFHKLRILDISDNQFQEQAGELFCLLIKEKSITNIQFQHNKIHEQEMCKLSRYVTENRTILKLNLNNCELLEQGALQLAKCLSINQSIQYFNINNNCCGDQGCAAIFNALCSNTSLIELYTVNNKIATQASKAFAKLIQQSQTLLKADLSNNFISDLQLLQIKASLYSKKCIIEELKLEGNLFSQNDQIYQDFDKILYKHKQLKKEKEVPLLQNQIQKLQNQILMFDKSQDIAFNQNNKKLAEIQEEINTLKSKLAIFFKKEKILKQQQGSNERNLEELNEEELIQLSAKYEDMSLILTKELQQQRLIFETQLQQVVMEKQAQKEKDQQKILENRKIQLEIEKIKKEKQDKNKKIQQIKEKNSFEIQDLELKFQEKQLKRNYLTRELKKITQKLLGLPERGRSFSVHSRKSVFLNPDDIHFKIQYRLEKMKSHRLYKIYNPNYEKTMDKTATANRHFSHRFHHKTRPSVKIQLYRRKAEPDILSQIPTENKVLFPILKKSQVQNDNENQIIQ